MDHARGARGDRIRGEIEAGIGWLTIDTPERRNALTSEMCQAITAELAAYAEDPAVHAVVLRGAGDKAFISGADISEFATEADTSLAAARVDEAFGASVAALESCPLPVIAMIRGFCMGGGVAMACGADLRIAADDALFAIPAAKLGIAYNYVSLRRLVETVGQAAAKDILFTGKRFDAQEAYRIGLVDYLVPAAKLESETQKLLETIAGNAPLSIRAAKAGIHEIVQKGPQADLEMVAGMLRQCVTSEDFREGQAAFQEKRQPVFKGR